MKQKVLFLENKVRFINPQPNWQKNKKTQINKITNEKGDITTNTNEIQSIIREYFENLYSTKLKKSVRNG
jgi:hypothetical protein